MTQPSGLMNLVRAAAGALPFVPRGDTLPDRTLTVDELTIDPANVAAYANVTGLRFGDAVPLTYPFALTFPTVMSLVTGFDFPFAAMGSVHIENHITQHRPILVIPAGGGALDLEQAKAARGIARRLRPRHAVQQVAGYSVVEAHEPHGWEPFKAAGLPEARLDTVGQAGQQHQPRGQQEHET